MWLHTYSFVLFYLVSLAVYQFVTSKQKKYFLLLISVIFCASFEPIFIAPLLIICFINYHSTPWVKDKWVFNLLVVLNLSALFLFKFSKNILYPIGISYYVFQNIDFLTTVQRAQNYQKKSFVDFVIYNIFFPRLISGPIENFTEFNSQLESLDSYKKKNVSEGFKIFLYGLLKKVIVADRLNALLNYKFFASTGYEGLSFLTSFSMPIVCVYFDFCSYSDMAYGIAKSFGINLTHNFNSPFTSATVREFWSKWHVSLFKWIRNNIILRLNHIKWFSAKHSSAIIIFCFTLSGLWHAKIGPLFWGITVGLGMYAQEALLAKFKLTDKFAKYALTALVIYFSSLFFFVDSIEQFKPLVENFKFEINYSLFVTNLRQMGLAVSDLAIIAVFSFFFLFIDYRFVKNRYFFEGLKGRRLFYAYVLFFAFFSLFKYYAEAGFLYSKF